jgi:hypothetical protein
MTLDGPISYFMRSERQKRQYRRKLEFLESQSGYLEYIQSDSVKIAIIEEFGLSETDLDGLIVEFNLANLDHQFVYMSKERVSSLFYEFVRSRMMWRKDN